MDIEDRFSGASGINTGGAAPADRKEEPKTVSDPEVKESVDHKSRLGIILLGAILLATLGYAIYNLSGGFYTSDTLQDEIDRGWQLYNNGSYEEALVSFNQAAILNPQHYDAYAGLGWSHYKLGEYPQALENFNRAIQVNPVTDVGYLGLGWTYLRMEEYDNAIESHNLAIAINPGAESGHRGLGWTYYEMGEYEMSINTFNQALLLDPDNQDNRIGIGISYARTGDFQKAEQYLTGNMNYMGAYHKDKLETYYNLIGIQKYKQEDFVKAAEYFGLAKDMNPDLNKIAWFRLGLAHYQMGEYQTAIDFINNSLDEYQHKRPMFYSVLGMAYLKLGDSQTANDYFGLSLDMYDNYVAYLGIARLEAENGDIDAARQSYDKALESVNPDLWSIHGDFSIDRIQQEYDRLI